VHCTHRGKGDAILFIHGMPTSHMLWNRVIDELSGHHRCFAIDLPGMGETPFIPSSAPALTTRPPHPSTTPCATAPRASASNTTCGT
jgi:pimeloyl-ACP methyl ester carboxylesterase